MRARLAATLALSALCLAGCATPGRISSLASAEAGVLNDYRTSLQAFAAQQTQLNADNDQRLRNLAELRGRNEAYVAVRLTAFNVAADKDASEIYALVSSRSAAEVLSNSVALQSLQPQAPSATAAYDPAQVNALVKQLNTVAKPASRWDELAGDLSYARQVQDAYRATLAAASSDASKAKTTAATTMTGAMALNTPNGTGK